MRSPGDASRAVDRKDIMDSQLSSIYDHGTFGVSRRTFVKLAAACGVTAMGGVLAFPF